MELSVPVNWDSQIIGEVANYPEVKELYGKITPDFIGGGRPSAALAGVNKRKAEDYITTACKYGLKFNYLLNAPCLDNMELTKKGRKEIRRILDWLSEIKVDRVTVANPLLLQLIKEKYPDLQVTAGAHAFIDTIQAAKHWINLGADTITLVHRTANRDFRFLKEAVKHTRCNIRLIVNDACLYSCPFNVYHSLLVSHASQSGHKTKGFFIDYCRLSCVYLKILNPEEIIKADWIRPEDLHHYEDIGIHHFKIVDRSFSSDRIKNIVEAYSRRHYEGNFLELIPFINKSTFSSHFPSGFFYKAKWYLKQAKWHLKPFQVNIVKLIKMRQAFSPLKIKINNRKLDGFLEHFLKEECRLKDCNQCGYCRETAEKVVEIDSDWQKETVNIFKDILKDIVSGGIFRYGK